MHLRSLQEEALKVEPIREDYGLIKIGEPRIGGVRTSYGKGIIKQFDKTPSSIVCGRFWELRWAFGCPFNCAYCYLRGTTRGNMRPRYVPVEDVLHALDAVFNDSSFNDGLPAIFNSGELSDSLMNPKLMAQIVDKFETQNKHKLFLLTKSNFVDFLLEKPRKQTIVAWSMNPPEVAKRYEDRTAPPEKRIEAARAVQETGYDTRIRIDPIFPIEGWRDHYQSFLYLILSNFTPNRIILGTPRGLHKTIIFAQKAGVDMSWTNYFAPEDTGWGKKLSFEQREEIYSFFYSKLDALGYDISKVSMCKETPSMWEALGRPFSPFTCACYGKGP